MNHWFLVGRDIMWLVVAVFPLLGMYGCGIAAEQDKADGVAQIVFIASIAVYGLLLSALYGGFIR